MGKSDHSEDKHELVLKNESSFIKEEEQKKAFHEGNRLNYISITNSNLSILYDYVANCSLLSKLVLSFNQLDELPSVLGNLTSLTFLDVSNNNLTALPETFSKLDKLESLIVTNNKITDTGLSKLIPLNSLLVVDFSHNMLTRVPACLCNPGPAKLHTVNIAYNQISEIDEKFNVPQLKDLNFANNVLVDTPAVLNKYPKVKFLNLSGNTFKDGRFNKLTNDARAKVSAIMASIGKVSQSKSKKTVGNVEDKLEDGVKSDLPTLTVHYDVPNMTVESLESVKGIRNFLVCCVIRGLDLKGENFKKFINIQTNLHNSLCDNRNIAAIGTHEISSFVPPLTHLALPPEEIHITALHKKTPVSGRELLDALLRDAELARKRTKRNTLNPLHKYLDLVKELSSLPCLIDANGLVISLQPMTNSDLTKMSENTTSVWVEVSSEKSITVCKEVMDALILETLKICPGLTVDEVRVTSGPDLISAYPDKNDLSGLQINRQSQKGN